MILAGLGGFTVSLIVCGVFLAAGINGWIGGAAAFGAFIAGRLIYGTFGAAAPAGGAGAGRRIDHPRERTRALTLLASAFGLGTILGPALAPWLTLGHVGTVEIGLAGPAFVFALVGAGMWVTVRRTLPDDRPACGGGRRYQPGLSLDRWAPRPRHRRRRHPRRMPSRSAGATRASAGGWPRGW